MCRNSQKAAKKVDFAKTYDILILVWADRKTRLRNRKEKNMSTVNNMKEVLPLAAKKAIGYPFFIG